MPLRRPMPRSLCLLVLALAWTAQAGEKISYNEQIRPIFNTSCVGCHGGVKKNAGVSFIYREEALGTSANGNRIIVPGEPENSELIKRISSDDPRYVMPPAHGEHHNEPLSPAQIKLLSDWIRQGAEWQEHWAYIKPERQAVQPQQQNWIRTPMDAYVLDQLEQKALAPSAEAPRSQWLRRVSLDLTGLPPTLEERQAFLADESDEAYEAVVDRLLASPRYGERWAAMWMDLARYADTIGYEKDKRRTIWPYRNWLINAFNEDLPFPEFIRDQLAGDLVKEPTTEQLISTGFLRLTQTNTEGGTDDEEFRVAAVLDRVNTTWSSFQGITFGCVQCHSHPYEPIPHEDFYRFMSFFNSTEDCDQDNDFPLHVVAHKPEERQQATAAQLDLIRLRRLLNQPGSLELEKPEPWLQPTYSALKISRGKLKQKAGVLYTEGTQPVHTTYYVTLESPEAGTTVTSLKVTILPDTDNPADGPFRGAHLSQLTLKKVTAAGKSSDVPFSYVYADSVAGPLGQDPAAALKPSAQGVGGYPKLFRQRDAVFVLKQPLELQPGDTLAATLFCKAGTTGGQNTALRRFQLQLGSSPAWQQLAASDSQAQLVKQLRETQKLVAGFKGEKVPVALERSSASVRESRVFIGGNRLNRGEAQKPGVPKILNPYGAEAGNRLEMAEWLAHPDNSLTARVFVNRVFSELFGNGIVQTLGDFGSSGLPPTNLALLDHLAIAFREDGQWQLKSLLKEMVLSATYRQDHRSTVELTARDPQNLLLARGPRTRLSAEMIRDHALSASGLIAHRLGGPSVMPPQPEGVWTTVYSGEKWTDAKGPDRYRRALYTFWKRTAPYPSMMTFDAASREVCNIQRISTNTPLQPLVTLNDPAYLEFAQKLAKRIQNHPDAGARAKIAQGYLLTTQQEIPTPSLDVLEKLHGELVEDYQSVPYDTLAKSAEEAAWVNIAGVLLNIDSALTK